MRVRVAAMLIQGSTCVYSRKVEFLYALVFQTLDLLAERKRTALRVRNRQTHTQTHRERERES